MVRDRFVFLGVTGSCTHTSGSPNYRYPNEDKPSIEQSGLKLLFPPAKGGKQSDAPDVSLRGEGGQGNRLSGSWPQGLKASEPLDHSDLRRFCMMGAGQTSNNKPAPQLSGAILF